jgi:hypothetical protein
LPRTGQARAGTVIHRPLGKDTLMSKAGRRSPKGEYTPHDHYIEVTSQIIAALEAGTPPWRKPWDTRKAGNRGMPCRAMPSPACATAASMS